MASSGAGEAGSREGSGSSSSTFPLQLAQGVLQDLLAKELNALLSPSDESKKTAFMAAKESLGRRQPHLLARIAASDPSSEPKGFFDLVGTLWFALRRHSQFNRAQPAMLETSTTVELLTAIYRASCRAAGAHAEELTKGGNHVSLALFGIGSVQSPVLAAEEAVHLCDLVRWWSDEVVTRRWAVTDAWGLFKGALGALSVPLEAVAITGLPAALVKMAVDRGCPVGGDYGGYSGKSPAGIAFYERHDAIFEALLASGADLLRPYGHDGWPLAVYLFYSGAGRLQLLRDLVGRYPAIIRAASTETAMVPTDLLGAAVLSGDADVVDFALTAGAPIEYRFQYEGRNVRSRPTLAFALQACNKRILELLDTKGKVLEGWRDKYDAAALGHISACLAKVAISAYPRNPSYTGERKPIRHNPQASACLDLVLAAGIVCPWATSGYNSLLKELDIGSNGCVLEERDALELLKRYHRAGFDVLHFSAPWVEWLIDLPLLAAISKKRLVLDWCLGELGAPAECFDGNAGSLLFIALLKGDDACAMLLLDKYKVRAAYPERGLTDQPVLALMQGIVKNRYTDTKAAALMKALVERSPSLFDLECFSERSAADADAKVQQSTGNPYSCLPTNPLHFLPRNKKAQMLEALLSEQLPGVAAMANRLERGALAAGAGRTVIRVNAAQNATEAQQWDCLALLLRYTDVRVTDSYDGAPSVAQQIKSFVGRQGGPSRALIASVEARARKERKEKAASLALTKAAGTSTNAFEDPSHRPLSLTDKEAKAKAKKKAAKKKAKAKRQAAAAANAGAGNSAVVDTSDDDSSSDDDDDDAEEDPDDNLVDSRNAPSLDLMLEQMGLKGSPEGKDGGNTT